MKKKLGPLPLWAWIVVVGGAIGAYLLYRSNSSSSSSSTSGNTVDPNNPLGLTYSQEQQDIAEGIDPNTGESYASEQAAADSAQNTGATDSGGGTSGDSSGAASTGDPTADAELAQIDSDIQTLNGTISGGGLTDQQPVTFGQEISDVVGGITALRAAGLLGTTTPATSTKKAAPALTAKGAKRARSGPTKPTAPKGFKAVGLGSGNWEFVPIVQSQVRNTTRPANTKSTSNGKRTTVSGKKKK